MVRFVEMLGKTEDYFLVRIEGKSYTLARNSFRVVGPIAIEVDDASLAPTEAELQEAA